MCKLAFAGAIYLWLAVMLGVSVVKVDEDVERDFASLPNFDYIEEVKRLRSESADEAKMLARYIFETEGMPNQAEARKLNEIRRTGGIAQNGSHQGLLRVTEGQLKNLVVV